MTELFEGNLTKIIKRLDALEKEISALRSGSRSLYTVLNENAPAMLTGNVDNYDPGNYDILKLESNGARTLYGISGGKKGRLLRIINYGANNIILPHLSATPLAQNRIVTPTAASITLGANDSTALYYDIRYEVWFAIVVTV